MFLTFPFIDQAISRFDRWSMSDIASRVENRRSGFSLPVASWGAFAWPASIRFGLVLFPVPAHR